MRIVCLLTLTAMAMPAAAAEPVSYRNEVMAVLSKAGCNAGACHGNQTGKGGLKLSLWGEDPQKDYLTLTHDLSARRTNPQQPDRSLLLLKATMQVPHQGGKRFAVDAPEYRLLADWMAQGQRFDGDEKPRLRELRVSPREQYLTDPESTVQIAATAVFADGTERDVTTLAVYELASLQVSVTPGGLVRREAFGETTVLVRYLNRQQPVRLAFLPAQADFAVQTPPVRNPIDQHLFAKLQRLRINPSELCDDATFIRRVWLDLLGCIPPGDVAEAFVNSTEPDKRAQLVEELLQRREFSEFWALQWSDLLRNEEKVLDTKGVEVFHEWIRAGIESNKPLDLFVRELIAARGSTYEQPPANYYRAMRDPYTRAESTAQLFLGVRLQCAKCHNHPFDRWTQDDYYGWSNLFARVDYKVLDNKRKDDNDKHEFIGEQVVLIKDEGDVKNPRTNRAAKLRFLGEGNQTLTAEQDRLEELAKWLTIDNRQFARMMANRLWFQLLGRGIVHPVDDFRATNPPANPELLEYLTDELIRSRYDLRHLLRLILNSSAYQLSSVPNDTNRHDEINFSRGLPRRLTAEQMLDSLSQALDAPVEFNGYPQGTWARQIRGVEAVRWREKPPSPGDQFLKTFGKPPRLQSCDCERSNESTLNQTFTLVSGPLMNSLLTRENNRLRSLLKSGPADQQLRRLFWSALGRQPTAPELEFTVHYLQEAQDPRAALEDIAWGLLTSSEFTLRR